MHLSASCKRIRGSSLRIKGDETVEGDFLGTNGKRYQFCKECSGVCLICGDNGIEVTACGQHYLCNSCYSSYANSCAPEMIHGGMHLKCPCGNPSRFESVLPESARDTLLENYRVRLQHLEGTRGLNSAHCVPVWIRNGIVNSIMEHALHQACPTCGREFDMFDGCAALSCVCGTHFCGLCFETCRDSSEAHEHVKSCAMNPYPGTYYVPESHLSIVRTKRMVSRVAGMVRTMFKRDGLIVGSVVRVSLGNLSGGYRLKKIVYISCAILLYVAFVVTCCAIQCQYKQL